MSAKEWLKTHKEIWLLLGLPFFIIMFMIVNSAIPPVYTIWVPLDECVPFCEYFIVPYVIWYLVYVGTPIFFFFTDKKAYFNCCFMLFGGLAITTLMYIVVPNCVPTSDFVAEGNGFFVWLTNLIRGGATRSAAFPSQHCVVALVADFAVQRSDFFKKRYAYRTVSTVFALSVCAATVFLKQHSVLDMVGSFCVVYILDSISRIWCAQHSKELPLRSRMPL